MSACSPSTPQPPCLRHLPPEPRKYKDCRPDPWTTHTIPAADPGPCSGSACHDTSTVAHNQAGSNPSGSTKPSRLALRHRKPPPRYAQNKLSHSDDKSGNLTRFPPGPSADTGIEPRARH